MDVEESVLPVPKYTQRRMQEVGMWEEIRQSLLDTHIEEMSPATHACSICCTQVDHIIHCDDCGPLTYLCQTCSADVHKTALWHVPCIWQNNMYIPAPIKYALTRQDGHVCPTKYWSPSLLAVIDSKGRQHDVSVELCSCEKSAVTLIRYHLWPSSPKTPKTAFTFMFMEALAVFTLDAHVPANAFTSAIDYMVTFLGQRLASPGRRNVYRAVVGDCLAEYLYHRSTLLTRHTICEHTIARSCPVCHESPKTISMDGNFGLVHKKSSGAGHGTSKHGAVFFANHDDVDMFVKNYAKIDAHVTNCSSFQAGNDLRSKVSTNKLDVTGVFGAVCKHDVPLMFLNMVHGERLSYPVYVLEQLLEKSECTDTIISYDISCLLHKHLKKRTNDSILERCTFTVPVFHSYAHNIPCQLEYGQRFVDGTGLTDGEGIERLWSYLRAFKKITKEMSLTNRHDLLTEALIFNTLKLIDNWPQHVNQRVKQVCSVQEEAQEYLQQCGENQQVVQQWQDAWQLECKSANTQDLTLTPTEKYSDALNRLHKKRCDLAEQTNDAAKVETVASIEKLQQQCTSLIKRSVVKTDDINNPNIQRHIKSGTHKKRMLSLGSMRQVAADRQYLLTQIKKYADGQSIHSHVSKQLSSKTTKLVKDLEAHNQVHPTNIVTFVDASTPTSTTYDDLSSTVVTTQQKQAVRELCKFKKASEEAQLVVNEIEEFQNFLKTLYFEMSDKIGLLNESKDRYNLGLHHLLSYGVIQLELYDDQMCHLKGVTVMPVLSRNYLTKFFELCDPPQYDEYAVGECDDAGDETDGGDECVEAELAMTDPEEC